MRSGSIGWRPRGDCKLLYEFLPNDTSRQTHSLREAVQVLVGMAQGKRGITVIDLGCGGGSSYDEFFRRIGKIAWVGLDITDSYEVLNRQRRELPFCAYDGVRVPFADGSADIVYSRQVFEHVRHPQPLLSEAYRVLKPGGIFVGSTSHLEPFHSRSFWNYTPYGFCVLLREAGFHSVQVRPGIDSLTLIGRRCFSYVKLARLFEPFFSVESPLNILLEICLRALGQPVERRNAFKLLFAGQFCFFAKR